MKAKKKAQKRKPLQDYWPRDPLTPAERNKAKRERGEQVTYPSRPPVGIHGRQER